MFQSQAPDQPVDEREGLVVLPQAEEDLKGDVDRGRSVRVIEGQDARVVLGAGGGQRLRLFIASQVAEDEEMVRDRVDRRGMIGVVPQGDVEGPLLEATRLLQVPRLPVEPRQVMLRSDRRDMAGAEDSLAGRQDLLEESPGLARLVDRPVPGHGRLGMQRRVVVRTEAPKARVIEPSIDFPRILNPPELLQRLCIPMVSPERFRMLGAEVLRP